VHKFNIYSQFYSHLCEMSKEVVRQDRMNNSLKKPYITGLLYTI